MNKPEGTDEDPVGLNESQPFLRGLINLDDERWVSVICLRETILLILPLYRKHKKKSVKCHDEEDLFFVKKYGLKGLKIFKRCVVKLATWVLVGTITK